MKSHAKIICAVTFFSIAMAALESAVVVYLRALYYPGEFTVALKVIDERILLVELARELATIVMLVAIGYLAGKNFKQRFAYFLISFAVWDIFYYIWLKAFIDWPSSVMDWDILFLIPVTWLGPVLAPVICSITMIVLAIVLLNSRQDYRISASVWALLITGCLAILFTFMKDYGAMIIDNNFLNDYANIMHNEDFISMASSFVPETYDWFWFTVGELLIVCGMLRLKATADVQESTGRMRVVPRT